MKQFLTGLLGNNTAHWSQSRIILAGAALIMYAVLANSYEYIAFGILFIVLRFKTKKNINVKRTI